MSELFGLEGISRALDMINDCVIVHEPVSGRICYANIITTTLLGYPLSDLLATTISDIIINFSNDMFDQVSESSAHKPIFQNLFLKHKNGNLIAAPGSRSAITLNNGCRQIITVAPSSGTAVITSGPASEFCLTTTDMELHNDAIRENERKYIAGEIHDQLGQYLSLLRSEAAIMGRRSEGISIDVISSIRTMNNYIDEMITAVRNISTSLRPDVLDYGLVASVEWLIGCYQKQKLFNCNLHVNEEMGLTFTPELTLSIFRMLQEALTNIVKHAGADDVDVSLFNSGDTLFLTVIDNGVGFNPQTSELKRSFGIINMKKRARLWGGELIIASSPASGTRLHIKIPLFEGVR